MFDKWQTWEFMITLTWKKHKVQQNVQNETDMATQILQLYMLCPFKKSHLQLVELG